uniref:Synergin gamma isoform X2 n=1 Tax=Geotrypetes seraphini TaxID=260995 RepID=A0A6P8NNS9_GEOSA|nr:synergin gamma isoform X2 [Geotrypetes seraphini]
MRLPISGKAGPIRGREVVSEGTGHRRRKVAGLVVGDLSFMFPVAGGIGPPQGMRSMQQQQQQHPYPLVTVMQHNMQGMMGMNYPSPMSPGPMAMQGGMPMASLPTAGMPYLQQTSYLGMRPAGPQYSPDIQKQFAEEQQKRFEQQQKLLEEDRKRRQFEEQKQKLRLLSSVKPKMGERSRDDALEAIKGNLDGFSREAKMHSTPSHPKKPDCPTPTHPVFSVPQHTTFHNDEEFSDFIQGPTHSPPFRSSAPSQPFQPFHPSVRAGQLLSEQAATVAQPLPPAQVQGSSMPHDTVGQIPYSSTSAAPHPAQNPGTAMEVKHLTSYDLNASNQAQIKLKTSEAVSEGGPKATASAASQADSSLTAQNQRALSVSFAAASPRSPEQNVSAEECGVGIFPSQDPIQPVVPSWIYNDSLVPELYKKIFETTISLTGIDTAKLYPILMSSGLPRETLGQIWALSNRITPGKLTKEELYTVLALIALTQRGMHSISPDSLNQFPTAPVPTLSSFPLTLPAPVSQQSMMPSGPAVSRPLNIAQPVMGINIAAPAGGTSVQVPSGFIPSYPSNQTLKPEDDDFQDFQDASKSGSLDDSFTDFQGDTAGAPKATTSQLCSSGPSLLLPLAGSVAASTTTDKYAVFKGIVVDEPSEDVGDKYSAFRELQPASETKSFGDGFADFKSGSDDGFTDFKTADSISPLEPSTKDIFPAPFPSLPVLAKQPTQQKKSVHLEDLDLFSSGSATVDVKPLSFPAAFSLSKPPSFPVSAPLSSSVSVAPAKNSSMVDEFGEFSLFGESANGASAGGQDDFADFMAFHNHSGSSEQKTGNKYEAFKPELSAISPPASSASVKSRQLPAATISDKYDIFKQLSSEVDSTACFEDIKDLVPSSMKNDYDFADFQPNRFPAACSSNSEKSLVDKVAAFKQAKEDSASVKSLDLPSIGGSSGGKDDSEDALSVQFDMKLTDVGGDLKHVLSDSSLDLPTVSGQHPPAADIDDLKYLSFGNYNNDSATSSLTSYDWSERDDLAQSKKHPSFFPGSEHGLSSATSVLQKKETSFGSSENITMTTVSKVTTFSSVKAPKDSGFAVFANVQDPAPGPGWQRDDANKFGDFARRGSDVQDVQTAEMGPSVATDDNLSKEQEESTDEFGEFQREKLKISKFDFLVANSQVKSSEEMIKSELATFDLSVQGTHKRSLSLGDKEISRSSPSSALEQPFRDRSNTLSEKPALPIIRDKYKDLTGEVEESERYAYEWQRCLESALQVIRNANDTLNGISSSSVCTEVIQSVQGMEYLHGVVEVYRVAKRVELGIKATAVCSEKLQHLLKDIDKTWNNLIGFMSLVAVTPDESALDFSSCLLRPGIKNAQELACGVCLLNVDSRSKAFNSETDNFKLSYGGHQYHASCANFWINCVEPKPPGLILPDLL